MAAINAAKGTNCAMQQAFVNESKARAVCCWDAPSQEAIEELFEKASVATDSVEEVVEFRDI